MKHKKKLSALERRLSLALYVASTMNAETAFYPAEGVTGLAWGVQSPFQEKINYLLEQTGYAKSKRKGEP